MTKYKGILAAQGLTDKLIARFVSAATTISDDYQKQYEIVSNRKTIV
jgi:hypothetical protein